MQTKQRHSSYTPTIKRPWLWLVLVGFLWLQFAGVVHKLSHTGTHLDVNLKTTKLEQLFPEHSQQNKSDCQLLDLQCGGMALSQPLPVLPLPIAVLQITQVPYFVFSVPPNYPYQARAPPQTLI
jgi:hypothetical protein